MELNFDAEWTKLKEGLTLLIRIIQKVIIGKKIGTTEYMNYYNTVYNICTNAREDIKDILYKNLCDLMEEIVDEEEEELEDKTDLSLLVEYLDRFRNYLAAIKIIRNIFRYMHSYWMPQKLRVSPGSVRDTYEMSLLLWRKKCYGKLQPKLLEALFDLITAERDGKQQDKSVISKMKDTFISLGVQETEPVLYYKKEFEEPFIANTKSYYTKESNEYLQTHSVSEYMKLAESRLVLEDALAKGYLHENTNDPLIHTLEEVLIGQHNDKLQDVFPAMLREDRNEDMRLFFTLLSRIANGLHFSSATMEQYLASITLDLIVKYVEVNPPPPVVKVSIELVGELIDLHQKYISVVANCFQNNPLFLNAVDKGFRKSINDENKTKIGKATGPEMIVYYCDHILKGGIKLSETEFEKQIDTIMKLFMYLDNKDLFYSMFQKLLAQRLLDKKSNDSLERTYIAKLKDTVGDIEVNKLQVMFMDIKVSEERSEKFKEYCRKLEKKIPFDTSVMVLNNHDWPSLTEMTVTLSPEFNSAIEAFNDFYKQSQGPNTNRVLKWQPSMANCVVTHVDDRGQRRELSMTAVQASILMLIYENDKVKFNDLRTTLAVPEGEKNFLKLTLSPLLVGRSKTPLLDIVGSPGKKEIADDDVITHVPLRCKERKLVFQKGTVVNPKPEEEFQARIPQYDAALVRVMKARRTAFIQELFSEASTHLLKRFKPDQRVLKKRMEFLIDKGYMKFDPDNRKKINYLA